MPWLYSVSSSTPPNYTWSALNLYNQHCSAISGVPANSAITQLKVYARGYYSNVSTRLAFWTDGGTAVRQSSTFTMTTNPQWWAKSITAQKLNGGTYWIGLYRNPSGSHWAGTTNTGGGTSRRKTNTSGFPSISSMSGYSTHDKEFYVGLFYITAPNPVTSVNVSRISDSKMSLSWTRNATTDQPYTYTIIERYDNVTGSYYRIAKLSGTPSSYNNTTVKADRYYRYRIMTYNTCGYSSYAYSSYINTTPDAPSNVVASRSGSTVILSWNDNSTNEDQFRIQKRESTDEGDTWGSWGSDYVTSANDEEYIDSSPYTYGQYRVRSEETSQSLYSDYVESNEVITIAPPNAPIDLSPDNAFFDADDSVYFLWSHNPVDGTGQSKFSLEYRVQGASWATPQLDETSSTLEYHEFAASTFTNGVIYEWRVKTWGQHATSSDWSNTVTFYCYSKPVGTITSPNGIDDYGYSLMTLQWLYSQSEGYGQSQYVAKLYDENDLLLEVQDNYSPVNDGSTGEAVFNYELSNNTDYKVTLQVQDTEGGWSEETEVEFTTSFYVPATPTIIVNNEEDGIVSIEITNPSYVPPEIETEYNNLYRSYDSVTYELVYSNIEPNTTVIDYLPNVGGDTYYYVNAVSDTPTMASSAVSSINQTLIGHHYLNGGVDYEEYICIYADILFTDVNSIDNVLKQFEGRTYPVKYQGTAKRRTITLSGDVLISDYETMKLITESTKCYYRDYKNNKFKCSITQSTFDKKDAYGYQFKCIIERIEEDDS